MVRAFTASHQHGLSRRSSLSTTAAYLSSSSLNKIGDSRSNNNISRPTLLSSTVPTSLSSSSSYRHGAWSRAATRLASTSYPASRTASVLDGEDDGDDDEDDLDAALDGILGQSPPSPPSQPPTRRIVVQEQQQQEHRPMPAPLVEEDVDWTSGDAAVKELLFTGHPRWTAAGLNPAIIDVLSSRGITHFTPVQAEAFAPVLARRDVIGRSRTGTGKTLAFGLPSITRLLGFMEANGKRDRASGMMRRGRTPSMLVLCPTRELARQVSDELSAVAKPVGLFVEVFHGGVSYDPQARALRTGVDIIVGTPGRIIDHLNRGNMDLTECDIVVLDEADEMLNMGFADDVEVRNLVEVFSRWPQAFVPVFFTHRLRPHLPLDHFGGHWLRQQGKDAVPSVLRHDSQLGPGHWPKVPGECHPHRLHDRRRRGACRPDRPTLGSPTASGGRRQEGCPRGHYRGGNFQGRHRRELGRRGRIESVEPVGVPSLQEQEEVRARDAAKDLWQDHRVHGNKAGG